MKKQPFRMLAASLALLGCAVFVSLAGCSLRTHSRAAEPSAAQPAAAQSAETKEQKDARMAWWRAARFGMFIHWGIYSVPAGTWQGRQIPQIGEWIMLRGQIPVADYARFAEQFNPVKYDAEEWVKLAKGAGMKYIIITSKHHDGFAMYPSKASPYNIFDATPFKRDPLKELADACRKHGLKLGFYYSQCQDWHHPGGAAYTPDGKKWDPAQEGSFEEYIDKIAVPQVREILTNYPISVLWWDTPKQMTPEQAAKFLPLLKLRPGIITNNRLGGGFDGDTETPEQFIPATGIPGRDFEVCMTMNDTWGYKSYDNNWKGSDVLIRNLVDVASKGGNYLLNVGPTSEGLIPQPSVERLKAVGEWMKANSESIYATSASPFKRLPWGRCTQRRGGTSEYAGEFLNIIRVKRRTQTPDKLYLHVFNWPEDGKLNVPLKNQIKKAYLLARPGRALKCTAGDVGVTIALPEKAPDPVDTVVVAEIEGEPEPLVIEMKQDPAGKLVLPDGEADIVGKPIKIQGLGHDSNVFWITPNDNHASWKARIDKPGTFQVQANYSCDQAMAGSEFVIKAGSREVAGKVESTGDWDKYQSFDLGTIKIDQAGPLEITLEATTKKQRGLMNLKSITLLPAR